MPPSLRDKKRGKKSKATHKSVKAALIGKSLYCTEYACTMTFHGNWFTKSGKPKRKDAHNYASTLVDIVCEHLGIDDSLIFDFRIKKKQDVQEFVHVRFHPIRPSP